jgi:hypothetical protein
LEEFFPVQTYIAGATEAAELSSKKASSEERALKWAGTTGSKVMVPVVSEIWNSLGGAFDGASACSDLKVVTPNSAVNVPEPRLPSSAPR